jgi:hypothetical protein
VMERIALITPPVLEIFVRSGRMFFLIIKVACR